MPMIQIAMPSVRGRSHPGRSRLDWGVPPSDVGDDVAFSSGTAVGRRTWACSAGRSASRCRSRWGWRPPRPGRVLARTARRPLPVKLWHDAQLRPEQVATRRGHVPISDSWATSPLASRGTSRAAAVGLHVRAEGIDLRLVEGWALRGLSLAAHRRACGRWTPGSTRPSPTPIRLGAAVRHTLQVGAVAGDAHEVSNSRLPVRSRLTAFIGDGNPRCRRQALPPPPATARPTNSNRRDKRRRRRNRRRDLSSSNSLIERGDFRASNPLING